MAEDTRLVAEYYCLKWKSSGMAHYVYSSLDNTFLILARRCALHDRMKPDSSETKPLGHEHVGPGHLPTDYRATILDIVREATAAQKVVYSVTSCLHG
jgi:hypothetical protein